MSFPTPPEIACAGSLEDFEVRQVLHFQHPGLFRPVPSSKTSEDGSTDREEVTKDRWRTLQNVLG